MIKLLDILREAKQVGPLYHFTSIESIYNILKDEFIRPNSEKVVSTTRNKNQDPSYFLNDYYSKMILVRIKLDGNKISNNYKIKPYLWAEEPIKSRPPAYLFKYEFEEQILTNGKNFPLLPYVEQIDIFTKGNNDSIISDVENILIEKNIPYNII
jgi:hypothetical protein